MNKAYEEAEKKAIENAPKNAAFLSKITTDEDVLLILYRTYGGNMDYYDDRNDFISQPLNRLSFSYADKKMTVLKEKFIGFRVSNVKDSQHRTTVYSVINDPNIQELTPIQITEAIGHILHERMSCTNYAKYRLQGHNHADAKRLAQSVAEKVKIFEQKLPKVQSRLTLEEESSEKPLGLIEALRQVVRRFNSNNQSCITSDQNSEHDSEDLEFDSNSWDSDYWDSDFDESDEEDEHQIPRIVKLVYNGQTIVATANDGSQLTMRSAVNTLLTHARDPNYNKDTYIGDKNGKKYIIPIDVLRTLNEQQVNPTQADVFANESFLSIVPTNIKVNQAQKPQPLTPGSEVIKE